MTGLGTSCLTTFKGTPLLTTSAHVFFTSLEGVNSLPREALPLRLGEYLVSSLFSDKGSFSLALLPNIALMATARPGVTFGIGSSKPGVLGIFPFVFTILGVVLGDFLGDAFGLRNFGESLELWFLGYAFGECLGLSDFFVTGDTEIRPLTNGDWLSFF